MIHFYDQVFCEVVTKLHQTQMVAPIFMITDDIIMKILIQYFICSFCLAIDLWMESDIKF
jgi:hypothetical protein